MNKSITDNSENGGTLTTNAGVWTPSSHTPYNYLNIKPLSSNSYNIITNYFNSFTSSSPSNSSLDSHSNKAKIVASHVSGEGESLPSTSERFLLHDTDDKNKRPCLQQLPIFDRDIQCNSSTEYYDNLKSSRQLK